MLKCFFMSVPSTCSMTAVRSVRWSARDNPCMPPTLYRIDETCLFGSHCEEVTDVTWYTATACSQDGHTAPLCHHSNHRTCLNLYRLILFFGQVVMLQAAFHHSLSLVVNGHTSMLYK